MRRWMKSKGMKRIMQGENQQQDTAAANAFEALSKAQSPAPDASFKSEKREAILDSMAGRLQEKPRHRRAETIVIRPTLSRSAVIRRVVLVPAIIIALFVVFTAGAYAMSLGKNPDSSLYGAKLFFESIRVSMTDSTEAKAQLELAFTQKRVEEMQYLASRNIGKGADRCAAAYQDELAAAQLRIGQLTGDAFDQASAQFLDITGKELTALDGFAGQVSGNLAPALERATQGCNGARQGMMGTQRMRMGPGGGGQNQPGSPGGAGGSGVQGGGGMMPGNGTPGGDNSGGMMSPGTSGSGMSGGGTP